MGNDEYEHGPKKLLEWMLCTQAMPPNGMLCRVVDEPVGAHYTGLSKKMDGIWNRYNLKSTGRIYTFGVLKYSEKFKVLDLP